MKLLALAAALVSATNAASCPYGACVYVKNSCNSTLYIERTSIDDSNGGWPFQVTTLNSGMETVMDITAWAHTTGQRLYAWWKNPLNDKSLNPMTYRDKVEINYCSTSPNTMCYNPTAVDYYGLPVSIGPYNGGDCSGVEMTGAPMRMADVKHGCPTKWVDAPPFGVCYAPGYACAINSGESFCHDLDGTLADCVNGGHCAGGQSTENVYGCSGWFAQQPQWCAALNRGVYDMVVNEGFDQGDPTKFFPSGVAANKYAKWIEHSKSPYAKEYTFPYDDYGGAGCSGYNSCTTNFMSVTFCPQG